jgi:uncharacterized protein YbjQ (UPF0145 family)
MKTKDIAKANGLDARAFDTWLKQAGYPVKSRAGSLIVDDNANAEEIVSNFREYTAEVQEQLANDQAAAQQSAADKQQSMSSMLITSGFNFDGYTITKYSGYISGDSAISVDRPKQGWLGGVTGNVGDDLMASLVHIRREALAELKEAAHALGCNAVIGVDFDYLTLDPETVTNKGGTLYLPFLFGVTANGNAVIIERNERTAIG